MPGAREPLKSAAPVCTRLTGASPTNEVHHEQRNLRNVPPAARNVRTPTTADELETLNREQMKPEGRLAKAIVGDAKSDPLGRGFFSFREAGYL